MKTLLLIAVLISCTAFRSFAQDPVPLEVWTTVKGSLDAFEFPLGISGGMSYIPNFKNGAIPHAFIVNYRPFDATFEQRDGKVFTWGFSNPTDTINRYTWAGKNFIPIFTPDINGDGYRDFMNKDGIFYLGTERDEPDTNKAYQIKGNGYGGYAKLNDDNCDDIYYYGEGEVANPYLAHFVFGNKTLQTFQKYTVISPQLLKDSLSYEQPKSIYKNKQGKWRLLTHSKGWIRGVYTNIWKAEKAAIRLYGLEFVKVNEDSTAVVATQIDEYKDPQWLEFQEDIYTQNPINWSPFNAPVLVYNSDNFPRILYYASMNTMPDKETQKFNSYATIIDLTEDKIVPTNRQVTQAITSCKMLKHSIDGDNREELIAHSLDKILVYSIEENGRPYQSMYFQLPDDRWKGGNNGMVSVDDINNDGFNDIALLTKDNNVGNYFAIVKGKNIVSTISENSPYEFSMGNPYPLPNTNHIILPIQSQKKELYSLFLYTVSGMKYTIFEQKEFDTGNTMYQLNTHSYPSGTYILRLTDGKHAVEKTILIQH